MTSELIVFIAAILLGILLYWRESKGNRGYRFLDKMLNYKDLQMGLTDRKGFVYQQTFLLRLVFVTAFFLIATVILQLIIPITIGVVSVFISMIIGTVIGTYVAGFIIKSTEIIEEQSELIEGMVEDSIGKGKEFIENLTTENITPISEKKTEEGSKKEEKSARERLKDKGLL
ncbi:hypothetical protein [Tenacibaculum maritimum]|uniref:hypothetical protein n=1 Tax=Tenacibaculum maritimum TaxID=107401 RepID=UPI000424696F|nr:hypothetical protein [Tenacibaculum maritimum]